MSRKDKGGKGQTKGKSKGKTKGRKADVPKQAWTIQEEQEHDLIEWLRSNSYLWLRSTHDYKKKKAAWEIKAQELNISLTHLEKWWKNLKDWYVRLSKKKSGQAKQVFTDREKWLLTNLSFYKGQYMSLHLFCKVSKFPKNSFISEFYRTNS